MAYDRMRNVSQRSITIIHTRPQVKHKHSSAGPASPSASAKGKHKAKKKARRKHRRRHHAKHHAKRH